ncbi:MAG: GtrA family protein [Acidaminococcus sp.]|uniref:GtrA family protein n=1 Tax=Acidaminococcus sp. TaxID=1872103 RepID=UPI003F1467EF
MEKSRVLEIGRFVLVGGISFLIDWGLLFICTEWLHIYYLYSSAISFTVSVLVNYFLCVVYVFSNSRKQTGEQAILFIGSSIVGLGLNQICMKIFVEYFFIYYMLAKIFSTGIVMIWNYWMKRKAVLMK